MLLALLLTLLFTAFFGFLLYYLDKEREPRYFILRTIATGFLAGLLERIFVRYFILKLFPIHNLDVFTSVLNDEFSKISFAKGFYTALLVGGLSQELVKIFAFEWISNRYDNEIDEVYDCMLYAVMVSLGFQVFQILIMISFSGNAFYTGFYNCIGVITSILTGILVGWVYAGFYKYPFKTKPSKSDRLIALLFGFLGAWGVHFIINLCFVWREPITTYIGSAIVLYLCVRGFIQVRKMYKHPA